MMNILNKFHINFYTYIFIFLCFISGYIKNILIIFFICIIHELGHIFFIYLFNYKIKKVEIFPFGGYTTVDKLLNTSINKDLIISMGGILFQFIFSIILLFLKNILNIYTYDLFVYYYKVLMIFNLLPIIPLDISMFLIHILEKHFSYRISYLSNFYISSFLLLIFILVNYLYNYDNYFIVLFLIYSIFIYFKNYKYFINRFLLERYLYDNKYSKIEYHTKNINDLKKETYHYFDDDNSYISERKKLQNLFDKHTNI